MPPKLISFPSVANQQRRAQTAHPPLDPVDVVAAAHPQLIGYDCIALPLIPCAESVLRLALALQQVPTTGLADFELASLAPPLQVRCPQATVAEMKRRLERLMLSDFPVYTLMPPIPGQGPEFALVDPKAMRPRPDHWCIVYIPPAAPGVAAHWTFTTVVPTAQQPEQPEPVIVYTDMPITDESPTVYWRCRPTRANMEAYEKKRSANPSRACHCCMALPCIHELSFIKTYPQARTLVMLGDHCFDGEWRGEVRKASDMDGYKVRLAPKGVTLVVNDQGQKSYHPDSWNVPAVRRPVMEVGDQILPIVYDFCCFHGGAINQVPAIIRPLMRTLMRVNNTWSEKLWPFFYWKYDIPVATRLETIRPYVLKMYHLERRRRGIFGNLLASGLSFIKTAGFGVGALHFFKRSNVWAKCLAIFLGYNTIRSSITHCGNLIAIMYSVLGYHFFSKMQLPQAERHFGNVVGTALDNAKMTEINSRLAVRDVVPREIATDVFRRAMNETKWAVSVTPEEFETWLDTVVNSPGLTVSIPPNKTGYCINCRIKQRTYRQECKKCQKDRRTFAPEPMLHEPLVTYVGRMGLWSRYFTPPKIVLKEDVQLKRGKKKLTLQQLLNELSKMEITVSCRGWNSGPIIDSNIPQCFPRGVPVAVIAFLIRLGTKRLHEAQERPWRLWYKYIKQKVTPLEPESRSKFLEHFHGEKKTKMIQAFRSIDDGYAVNIDPLEPICQCSGFQKAEKSYSYKLCDACSFIMKEEEKPRFICCPAPEFLAEIGPYTHAQLKWLSATFTSTSHLFYAGCATPDEMNEWLNWTLHELPEPVTITDDITAIDSNHSTVGMAYHGKLRKLQFPHLKQRVELLFEAERTIRVRVGPYTFTVIDINGSGVSDTSYKNSAPCLILRVLAILYALIDMDGMTDEEILQHLQALIKLVYTSAAGDDGITRMPRVLFGVDTMTPTFKERYQAFWAEAGFSVKVQFFPEHRWRMATYLAMRPVWGGTDYQWAPEPARRMKSMFWQIDNAMHPTAWARGVATQVLQQGRHCPVLSDICEWFLARTTGPIGPGESKPYSPWDGYITSGVRNMRAEMEFLADYHIDPSELHMMRRILSQTESVYVNLGFSALRRVMLEES